MGTHGKVFILAAVAVLTACPAKVAGGCTPDGHGGGAAGRVTVTPHLDAPVSESGNTVFCSTFQIAWNLMIDDITGGKILLEGDPGLAAALNRRLTGRTGLDGSEHLAMAGFGRDRIADRINEKLKSRFGVNAPLVDAKFNDDDVILAYAYLRKEMSFPAAFEGDGRPLRFRNSRGEALVEGFGIGAAGGPEQNERRDQVEVIRCGGSGDQVVRLRTGDPADEIVLADIPPGKTLLETYEQAESMIGSSRPGKLKDGDILLVPVVDLSADHSCTELIGLHLLNEGFEEYFVCEARQDVRFRLDESGAGISSEGVFAIQKGGGGGKSLIFSDPFLLYCKKKGERYPYFAVWVGDAGVMIRTR